MNESDRLHAMRLAKRTPEYSTVLPPTRNPGADVSGTDNLGQAQVEEAQRILGGATWGAAQLELMKGDRDSKLPRSLREAYRRALGGEPVEKAMDAASWADAMLNESVGQSVRKALPAAASADVLQRSYFKSYDAFVRQDPLGKALLAMSLDGRGVSPAEYVRKLRGARPDDAARLAEVLS